MSLTAVQIISLILANITLYYMVRKFLVKMENGAMRFLFINIFKDVAWMVWMIATIEKSRGGFFTVLFSFIIIGSALYYFVVREFNRSN